MWVLYLYPCLVYSISIWLGTGKYGMCLIHCVTKSMGNSKAEDIIVFNTTTGCDQTSDKDKIDNVEISFISRPLNSNYFNHKPLWRDNYSSNAFDRIGSCSCLWQSKYLNNSMWGSQRLIILLAVYLRFPMFLSRVVYECTQGHVPGRSLNRGTDDPIVMLFSKY